MAQSNGGPAFPAENETLRAGMSLRDYFAAKAMVRYVVHQDGGSPYDYADIAERAYQLADEMLKAREK